MRAEVRARAAVVAVTVVAAAVLTHASISPVRSDDFGFLAWGLQVRGEPLAWVRGVPWNSYWRPLHAATWQLAVVHDVTGALVRWLVVGATVATTAALAWVGARRRGAVGAVAAGVLLLGNAHFVDLANWRSWITTAVGGAILAGGLALARDGRLDPRRSVAVAGLALLALGFKEPPALVLSALVLLSGTGRARLAGAVSAVAVLAASSVAGHKLDLGAVPGNLHFHLETLGQLAFALPLVLGLRWPRLPAPAVLASAAAVLLPPALAGGLLLTAVCAAVLHSWPVAVLLALAWLPPLVGASQARQYLVEGWLVLSWWLLRQPPAPEASARTPWIGIAVAALAALPVGRDHADARASARDVWAEQQAFLARFDPAPAEVLYRPDPMYSLDLDALVWMKRGARFADDPAPTGTAPVAVGPRSGVWADLQPGEAQKGDGNRKTDPDDAPSKSVP